MFDLSKSLIFTCLCLSLWTSCGKFPSVDDVILQKPSLFSLLASAPPHKHGAIIQQAWQQGEDMEATSSDGSTVLHYLVTSNSHNDLVERIIKKHPFLATKENKHHISAVHVGAIKSSELLDIFIKHKINLNISYRNKNTLFHKLVTTNDAFESIEKLLVYRQEIGLLEFLDAKNQLQESAFNKLCISPRKALCHAMFVRLLNAVKYTKLLDGRMRDLIAMLEKKNTNTNTNTNTNKSSDHVNNNNNNNNTHNKPDDKKPLNKKMQEEEKELLALWRERKSNLASVASQSQREQWKKEARKDFLALSAPELELLLEQDWVWTSLLDDIKKEIMPELSAPQLNILVKTLTNNSLQTRIGNLDQTLASLIDEINAHDDELLDKLEAMVFAAQSSAKVAQSLEKKLRAHMVKKISLRANALNQTLKDASEKRNQRSKQYQHDTIEAHQNYYEKILAHEVMQILNNNLKDKKFWDPLQMAPELVLTMQADTLSALFKAVVAKYKTDPLPIEMSEPLVILSRACRKLDPLNTKIFEENFIAITEGAQDNLRDLLLNILTNKVANYSGIHKTKFMARLKDLKEKRMAQAKKTLITDLNKNIKYNKNVKETDLQRATLAYKKAPVHASVDDQIDDEENIAGYVLYADRTKLDNLWKQLSRKETGLSIENNIKQCLAWALAYMSADQMLKSLELESFWKIISAYPDMIGFALLTDNLILLFKKLNDPDEERRRSNLTMILKDIIMKMDKPKDELHEALDAIEQATRNKLNAKQILAAITSQRSLPKNRR